MKVLDFSGGAASLAPEDHPLRLFGVEVELENATDPPDVPRWTRTEDGSLRNHGVEYVSVPSDIGDIEEAVLALYAILPDYDMQSSARTGIHVHVNCLDYTLEQIGGVLAIYSLMEPIMFRICGMQREANIFCVPFYRAPDEMQTCVAGLQDYSAFGRTTKYSALYLRPLVDLGTLEFRHAPTFEDVDDLIFWIHAIDRLVTYGVTHTPDEILTTYYEEGPAILMRDVWGSMADAIEGRCEVSPDELIEDADSVSVAELLLPCTYKAEMAWADLSLHITKPPVRDMGIRLPEQREIDMHEAMDIQQEWLMDDPDYPDGEDEIDYDDIDEMRGEA